MSCKYYIETSVGRIYLEPSKPKYKISLSDELENYGEIICQNVKISNEPLFKEFTKLYSFNYMKSKLTKNGWFLIVSLNDPYYGSPEYKIFNE